MPTEPLALAIEPPPGPPSEQDYQAFCVLLGRSERGRALLAEYARRNRNADTEALLAAIARIETRLRADAAAVQRLRDDLRMLLTAIRLARPEIDSAGPAAQVVKLKLLLDLLERRLDALAAADAPAPQATASALPAQPAEAPRARLAAVPRPDEPELPIPSPVTAAPAIAVVPSTAMMPEINFLQHTRPAPVPAPEAVTAPAAPAAAENTPAAEALPLHPLSAIMALSEEERLALFT